MGDAPFGIVRHREGPGTVHHGDRIDRFWQSKKDGSNVMVVRYLRVANENKKRVIFVSEDMPTREVSCDLHEFLRDFKSRGNSSDKF